VETGRSVLIHMTGKRYTFNIKDELLPLDPDTGREQSTVSYEYDFVVSSNATSNGENIRLFISWSELKATYRGREKHDAPELNRKSVRRFGIMCRSFFGEQEGDFELVIERIGAACNGGEEKTGLGFKSVDVENVGPSEKKGLMEVGDPEKAVKEEKRGRTVHFQNQRAWNKLPWILLFAFTAAIMLRTCYPVYF